MGILSVSVLAWVVLWLITLLTYLFDGVLQLAAVIIGLGSFPVLLWLGLGGLDLLKHMVGERVSSLIDKGGRRHRGGVCRNGMDPVGEFGVFLPGQGRPGSRQRY